MPYDITDAKEDILLLDNKVNYIFNLLKEKGLLPKEEETKK